MPLAWSLDHAGPLTRSVAAAAVVLGAIAGHDPADATSSREPVPDYVAALDVPVQGLRIGLLREFVEQAAPEVSAAIEAAAVVLRGLGCEVRDVVLPTAQYSLAASYAVLSAEALPHHEAMLRCKAAEYAPDVRGRLLAARCLTATDYVKGQKARALIRDEVTAVLRTVDCLLTPTLAAPAPAVGAVDVQIGSRTEPVRMALTAFTRLFNLSGHPAVCLPCGFNTDGLPLSLQIVGRAFDEATVLRLAHAYEQATD